MNLEEGSIYQDLLGRKIKIVKQVDEDDWSFIGIDVTNPANPVWAGWYNEEGAFYPGEEQEELFRIIKVDK